MTLFQRPLCYLVFLLLFLFVHILEAANLDTKHPAQGALKVRLDYGLATQSTSPNEASHRWVYSSYLVFNEPVSSITDGQLRLIAENAHKEMEADMKQYEPRDKDDLDQWVMQPSVMTIMAFDNKIILSSSQRGRSGFLNSWPDSPVRLALDRCSTLWRDRLSADPNNGANPDETHKNQAKCGEVNGFHQYYMTHDTPIYDLNPKARVTSVLKSRKTGKYFIVPPCGEQMDGSDSKTEWGCNLLVDDQKVDYIPNSVPRKGYGLHKIAGGVQKKGQIQMCTKNNVVWEDESGGANA
ncbi:hypothetical protein NM208_g1428 [Fusarium decemcellulare]|uniref:Uncharacterized protein n=1 Tax=Fusarium decemcellulare TaxID=57161 RepID=A0ACC1SW56_9HYPO|nr:hypothetical protein NM208_g1428 [Fusarium decemcellulare]